MSEQSTGDDAFHKALLSIAQSYAKTIYDNTDASKISEGLLGKKSKFSTAIKPREDASIYSQSAAPLVECAIKEWNNLSDRFKHDKTFPNIYSLLFFLKVLTVDRVMAYRGQHNGRRALQTTLTRRLNEGWNAKAIDDAKEKFVNEAHLLSDRTHLKLTPDESEALSRHYEFPSDYLDFSLSLGISAFFALGGKERYNFGYNLKYITGSIWALDIKARMNYNLKIITLPKQIMRPWLQRGIFLDGGTIESNEGELNITKFEFCHSPNIILDELFDLGAYYNTPIPDYFMPPRDPLEYVAKPIRGILTSR